MKSAHGLAAEPVHWRRAETLVERIAALRSQLAAATPMRDPPSKTALERSKRWRSQFPFTDGDIFTQRLAAAGITEDEFMQAMDHSEGAPADCPSWLRALDEAYSSFSTLSSGFAVIPSNPGHAFFPFLRAVEPIVNRVVTRLREGAIELSREHGRVPFDPQAVHQMFTRSLLSSLQRMLGPTMILQLNVARIQDDLDGESSSARFQSFIRRLEDRDFSLQILREYPVLTRQLVCCADAWLESNLAFLRHLSYDWAQIRSTFSPRSDPGQLAGIQAQLGDSHRRGRSVLTARFNSGLSVVYKPRSVKLDAHFQEFLVWINRKMGYLALKTLTLIDQGTHGWVEFVSREDCASHDGVSRFYERQGVYLALLYLLNGTDCHCENVIAVGEHPVVVDLETLFHPRIEARAPGVDGIAGECFENSVLRTSLLPRPILFAEGAQPFDRSGLGGVASQITPFALPQPERSGTDEMQLIRRQMPIRESAHRPMLQGMQVKLLDGDAIARGFRRVYEVLLTHKKELLSVDSPLARFRGDEVRVVLRQTLTYGRLLAESFHPDVLRDALERDGLFDLLWAEVPHRPHLGRVTTAECEDLRNGDVPIFTTRVGSKNLFTSGGESVPDYFVESGDESVRRRAESLSEPDLERQLWLIQASLATLDPSDVRMSRQTSSAAYRGETVSPERLLTHARAVGDRLEVLAAVSQKRAGWIGLIPTGKGSWSVRPLGPDLYEGNAGIVLFLAYLAEVTKEDRYQVLASAGASNLHDQAQSARHLRRAIGAFSGWGGLIYVYSHLAVLWENDEFLDKALSLVGDLLPLINQDEHYDIIGGAAGCIGSLLVMYRVAPSDAILSAAIQCGDHLMRSARQMECGIGWPTGFSEVPLAGFSHGVAGIAWSLLALASVTGEVRFKTTATAALEYEHSLFEEHKRNWADLRSLHGARRSPDSTMTAWCHGAPGVGLSRLYMLEDQNDNVSHRELTHAVETTLASGFGGNHSLCHGDLGNLDFVLQASHILNNNGWRADAQRILERVLQDVEQTGWKCGIAMPVEIPGLMTGLSGIGYGMLRMAQPRLVPSVLVLGPPLSKSLPTHSANQNVSNDGAPPHFAPASRP